MAFGSGSCSKKLSPMSSTGSRKWQCGLSPPHSWGERSLKLLAKITDVTDVLEQDCKKVAFQEKGWFSLF